jgi:serine 3-dehydrogenase
MIKTNVIGLFAMTTTFSKGMVQRSKGHIINIGSISGHYTYSGGSTYCATKFAVDGYTTAVQQDMVGTPIRVSKVSPGMVETEFSKVGRPFNLLCHAWVQFTGPSLRPSVPPSQP